MVDQLEENPDIPVRVVQEQFQRKYSVGISRMKAYRAKIELELGKNPGDQERQFRRIYICLAALKEGFKALGRDLLGLDGAFMKGSFPGQMLTAVGVDSNNGIYPVAYAIVESENLSAHGHGFWSSWQGILQAVTRLFPCAEHRYCLRHIYENMRGTFNGDLYKNMLWKCASATTIPEFQTAMDELKAFNKKAHLWLSKIPHLLWTRSHFSGKVIEGRDRPIISTLEYIREYLMRRIVTVLKVIEKCDGLLTPRATELLEGIKKDASHYHVQWNGGEYYEVSGKPNHARVVNLATRTWLPCRHVVAALWCMAENGGRVGAIESWAHPVHTMERWRLVYSHKINPLNGRALWTKIKLPTIITPPKHHNQVGRPEKLRKRSTAKIEDMTQSGNLTKKHTQGACSKCKQIGHNSRTCKGKSTTAGTVVKAGTGTSLKAAKGVKAAKGGKA
ncbi:uncharacterized protein LOC110919766 [Helianthus annuus]|uniref:uncharacterized protein LOC110919766 n=1 Tax=Helianthus annuus TaxID=4232 RepID=UPI0016533DF2|nr:uncharacterized protein LOC110919766 [Helianthus annuus]